MANGVCTVMFEGVPTYPDAGRLWAEIEQHKIKVLYMAPTAIRALMREGDDYVLRHDRSSVKVLGSVGEPINPKAWRWYYEVVGNKAAPIVDTWWQTETGGILITALPGEPMVKPGVATKPMPGIEPGLVDAEGTLMTGAGEGNLVLKQSWPGQMRTVYGDHQRFIDDETARRAYECDALTMYRQLPLVVVLPETVDQVSEVMALANDMNVKVVPRGAGTSLSGGSLPLGDGILLGMGKFNRVLEVDVANRCARVQPGVANLAITKAVEHLGFYYAPDPSSQIACSIGGNVGENAGGVHCLKYGLTTNNLLGLQIVLMDGEVVELGGKHLDSEAYDLMGLMTGSEGLLGVITEVTVRILQKPQTARGMLMGFPPSTTAPTALPTSSRPASFLAASR